MSESDCVVDVTWISTDFDTLENVLYRGHNDDLCKSVFFKMTPSIMLAGGTGSLGLAFTRHLKKVGEAARVYILTRDSSLESGPIQDGKIRIE